MVGQDPAQCSIGQWSRPDSTHGTLAPDRKSTNMGNSEHSELWLLLQFFSAPSGQLSVLSMLIHNQEQTYQHYEAPAVDFTLSFMLVRSLVGEQIDSMTNLMFLIHSCCAPSSDAVRLPSTARLDQRIPNSCSTLAGDSCVFPFSYKGDARPCQVVEQKL